MLEAPIHVSMSKYNIARMASEQELRAEIFLRRADAGMPVILSPTSFQMRVEKGTIYTWQDRETDDLMVRWEPDQLLPAATPWAQRFASLWARLCGRSAAPAVALSSGQEHAATHLLRNRNR